MRNLKLSRLAAVVAVSAVFGGAASNTTKAESAFARAYEQQVSLAIALWVNELQVQKKDIEVTKLDIARLKRISPPPSDLDVQIKLDEMHIAKSVEVVQGVTRSFEGTLSVTLARTDSTEGPGLAKFVASEITKEAKALDKFISVAPDMKWSPGTGKTGVVRGTVGLKIQGS